MERQEASPIWGVDDTGEFAPGASYQVFGLDFDADAAGTELVDERAFQCVLENGANDTVRLRYKIKLRVRNGGTGAEAFTTDFMVLRTGYFPNPFLVANQTAGDINHFFLTAGEDITQNIQFSVTGQQDPTDTLCDRFENVIFGATIANSGQAERTFVYGDGVSVGYSLKPQPSDQFYMGGPVTSVGTLGYWAIEASAGAQSKGGLLHTRFLQEPADGDGSNTWRADVESSMVGDVLGTGDDVIRTVEVKPAIADDDYLVRRTRHYNVRTGTKIGSDVIDTVLD